MVEGEVWDERGGEGGTTLQETVQMISLELISSRRGFDQRTNKEQEEVTGVLKELKSIAAPSTLQNVPLL
jgi:hypothetical protein